MKAARFRRLRKFLAVCLLLLITAPTLAVRAQSGPTGTLSGTVADQQGAVIAGATVTLNHIATGTTRTINSDKEGRWRAAALPLGS